MDDVAHWLARWREGDAQALDQLLPHIYADLRELASRALRRDDGHRSLQPTELVHEMLLRMLGGKVMEFADGAHLMHTAARMMRQILVNRVRAVHQRRHGAEQFVREDELTLLRDKNDALEVDELDVKG